LSIITISRQTGSLGNEISESLSTRLGWELLNRDLIISGFLKDICTPNDMYMLKQSAKFYLSESAENITYLEYMKKKLREYSQDNSLVLVGSGSQMIFADDPEALHVRIIAPFDLRVLRVKKLYHINDIEAEEIVRRSDKKQKKFISTVFNRDLDEARLYHLVMNTARLSVFECVNTIITLNSEIEISHRLEAQDENKKFITNPEVPPQLKNPSEMEFARILDMYHIDWQYEPKTFPIEWDAEGNISLAFSPDFYLPRFDTYIELTTMNQKYITRKNKKMKKLKELYPDINIRIVNKKDFNTLIDRFRSFKGES